MTPESDPKEQLLKLRKEFQEYKAKNDEMIKAINQREALINRFWKERIAYISIIVGLVVALISMT